MQQQNSSKHNKRCHSQRLHPRKKLFVARETDLGMEFPARTVWILCLCMIVNIYTLVNLFPYVGVMAKDLLELETTNEIGYYAGYVASAFTFGRFVSGYPLGHLTDSLGRKPMIIGGLLSMMLLSLAFGLSPTFGFAIGSRLLLGVTNGIAPALRTTMRETCGQEHVMKGMTYLGGGKAVSLVLGTGIGGLLSQPAVNYPNRFSADGIFGRYPFLLPNLVGSITALLLVPVVILFIPETMNSGARRTGTTASRGAADEQSPADATDAGAASAPPGTNGSLAYQPMAEGSDGDEIQQIQGAPGFEPQDVDTTSKGATATKSRDDDGNFGVISDRKQQQEPPGLWGPAGLLAVPHVKMLLFLVGLVQVLLIGFEAAYPLWALSTPDHGGLGWDIVDIGQVLLAAGIIVGVVRLLVLPGQMKVLGITTLQRIGCIVAIVAFVSVPFSKFMSWNDRSLHAVAIINVTLVYCGMGVVVLALTIASTTIVPSDMRGKLSGLYNTIESLGRFLGSAGFATMFAWSISTSAPEWVDHTFVFFVTALFMSLACVLAWKTITDQNMIHEERRRSSADDAVVDCGRGNGQRGVGALDLNIAGSGKEADFV